MKRSLLNIVPGLLAALGILFLLIADRGASAQPEEDPVINFTRAAPLGPVIDARPGATAVLDITACVDEAMRTNDRLKAERLRADELQGQKKQALSTGMPTLDLVGDWSHGRDPSFALDSTFGGGGEGGMAPPPGSPEWFEDWLQGFGSLIPAPQDIPAQTFYRTSLDLNWTVNPIQIMGATGAARLAIDQQDLAVEAVAHVTAESTVEAYYSIIRAAEKILAVEAQLANQSELVDIMKMRYELGMATRLDTLQAAVTLANIRPQLSIAQANLRNEGSRLNAIMGRRPEEPLQVAETRDLGV